MSRNKRLAQAESSMYWGSALGSAGLVLCLVGSASLGGPLVVVGLLLFVFGIHSLGRAADASPSDV